MRRVTHSSASARVLQHLESTRGWQEELYRHLHAHPELSMRYPYTYWGVGGFTPDQTVYPNHSPYFAPAVQPTLDTGTEAVVVAALAHLAAGRPT